MPKEGDTAAKLTSGGLALTFTWRGDRFEHSVTDGEASLDAATAPSVETPVYQEVHQQGDLVFASGMSGDNHWSASFEPTESGYLCDIACRAKTQADHLGVAYEGDAHIAVDPIDDTELTCPSPSKHLLKPAPPAGDPPYTVRCRYRIDGGVSR